MSKSTHSFRSQDLNRSRSEANNNIYEHQSVRVFSKIGDNYKGLFYAV